MDKTITINDFSKHLFWDVNVAGFDFEKHKVHLINKVLEYGLLSDWDLLKQVYGLETIKEVSLNLRSFDVVSLSYLSALFNIDKTEFRCYIHKQLYPTYCNS